jgi:hypothetical protein
MVRLKVGVTEFVGEPEALMMEPVGPVVSIVNEDNVVVAESLPPESMTEKAQLEYVPSASELKVKELVPEETLVLVGVQEPAESKVPAFVDEKEKEGVLLVEGVVMVETPEMRGGEQADVVNDAEMAPMPVPAELVAYALE